MSKKKRPLPQPMGISATRGLSGLLNQQPQQPTKKSKKKRVKVQVGDLVGLQTPIGHMTGWTAEVIDILDRDRVVVKAMGCQYEGWESSHWVVLTYRPQGLTTNGDDMEDVRIFIRKVIYARNPAPPKPPKVKSPKEVTVIAGQAALVEVLTSATPTAKHIDYIPDSEEPPL